MKRGEKGGSKKERSRKRSGMERIGKKGIGDDRKFNR
jgi:hypothetical protein